MIRGLQTKRLLGKIEYRSGRNLVFSCPFHANHQGRTKQNTPSFAIHIDTGYWNCFGATCKRGSKSIYRLFAELSGIPVIQAREAIGEVTVPLSDLQDGINALGEQSSPYTPVSMAPYPKTKKIAEGDMAYKYLLDRNIPVSSWGPAGVELYDSNQNLKTFNPEKRGVPGPRLILPIIYEGACVGYSARALNDAAFPKYYRPIENIGSCLYNPFNYSPHSVDTIFVVEGEFDVLACHREKIPAVATFSAHVSLKQAAVLARFNQVIFLYDPDPAGSTGAKQAIQRFGGFFDQVRNFSLPNGMDPGDMPVGFGKNILSLAKKGSKNNLTLDRMLSELEGL